METDDVSLYVVLVGGDFKQPPGAEPTLPQVVAHNLNREAAERWEVQLSSDSVEGQATGWMPFLWKYEEPHADTEPANCIECAEIVLEHCKRLLHILQQEKAKRPA